MDSVSSLRGHQTAVTLSVQGSDMEEANAGDSELAPRVQQAGAYSYVRASFVGPGQPELGPAIAQAVGADFHRIVMIPYFGTLEIQLPRDLPGLVAMEKEKYPQVEIHVGRSLEDDPETVSPVLNRIREVRKGTMVSQ